MIRLCSKSAIWFFFILSILLFLHCESPDPLGPGNQNNAGGSEIGNPERGMYGVLVYGEGANPASGAIVEAFSPQDGKDTLRKRVTSNDTGLFLFDSLPADVYTIKARFKSSADSLFATYPRVVYDTPVLSLGTDTLRPPGEIAGRITSVPQQPTIVCFIPGTSYDARTDENGNFVLDGVPEGTYSLAIMAYHFGTVDTTISPVVVTSDKRTDIGTVQLPGYSKTLQRPLFARFVHTLDPARYSVADAVGETGAKIDTLPFITMPYDSTITGIDTTIVVPVVPADLMVYVRVHTAENEISALSIQPIQPGSGLITLSPIDPLATVASINAGADTTLSIHDTLQLSAVVQRPAYQCAAMQLRWQCDFAEVQTGESSELPYIVLPPEAVSGTCVVTYQDTGCKFVPAKDTIGIEVITDAPEITASKVYRVEKGADSIEIVIEAQQLFGSLRAEYIDPQNVQLQRKYFFGNRLSLLLTGPWSCGIDTLKIDIIDDDENIVQVPVAVHQRPEAPVVLRRGWSENQHFLTISSAPCSSFQWYEITKSHPVRGDSILQIQEHGDTSFVFDIHRADTHPITYTAFYTAAGGITSWPTPAVTMQITNTAPSGSISLVPYRSNTTVQWPRPLMWTASTDPNKDSVQYHVLILTSALKQVVVDTVLADTTFDFSSVLDHDQTVDIQITPVDTRGARNLPETIRLYDVLLQRFSRYSDSLALIDLFDSLQGMRWKNRFYWRTDKPIDTWGFVRVGPGEAGRVYKIDLQDNNLVGYLPATIGHLTALQALDLSDNAISRTLPPALFTLPRLTVLDVSKNSLVGELPAEFSTSQLVEFNCSDNLISGPLPPGFTSMRTLKKIEADRCNFSGALPRDLGAMMQLYWFAFRNNSLQGTIPASIGQLDSLFWFDVISNNLTGYVPVEIANCDSLRVLNLGHNNLQGTIPLALQALGKYSTISLAGNEFTGIADGFTSENSGQINVYGNRLCFLSPQSAAFLDTVDPHWQQSQRCE